MSQHPIYLSVIYCSLMSVHTLIRRNTTIPTRTQLYPIFTNAYAYQVTATIRIFEGEHYLTKYNVRSVS
jgi:molecular chaperone DnaK (HSP70)